MGTASQGAIARLLAANPGAGAITDKLGKLPLQLALESRPRDAGVLQLLAGVCPHGRELMVAFFMEQLNMDANDVVRLAQRLQQEHQRRLSK